MVPGEAATRVRGRVLTFAAPADPEVVALVYLG